jgi:hypothetical protein
MTDNELAEVRNSKKLASFFKPLTYCRVIPRLDNVALPLIYSGYQ